MPSHLDPKLNSTDSFRGFALPTSNTTYTPNQFFDVCLPHHSRGCVRLVGFLIRKTLGWCDEQGNPQSERHLLSWADLEGAGISRDMIRDVLDEAISGHFIHCVRSPMGQKAGQPALSGLYELKWDERPAYTKDPREFRGFFAGEGNRTYIPNQFFDILLRQETLAVVKVVGSVIRFSIGFQNKWGHRRRNVSLSYQHIQNYSRVRDRKTLSAAIRRGLESNYIERIEEGYFDPEAGKLSRAAVYAVKWLNSNVELLDGQKNPPAETSEKSRSKIPTGNGQKTPPEQRTEIPTGIEINQTNKTSKQKAILTEAAVSFEKLKAAGFDEAAANALSRRFPFHRIEQQIEWIDERKFRTNRLGMLRKAIEEDWQAPAGEKKLGQPNLTPARRKEEGIAAALTQWRDRVEHSSSTQHEHHHRH
jgi:hypothetical protein